MSKKVVLKNILKAVVFLLLLGLLFVGLQKIFVVKNARAFQNQSGFYQEKPDGLDGVYVGASNVHAFWAPPLAWQDHGIAVWSFSVDSMPARAIRFMVAEARKTQPDAVYIVNLNSFKKPKVAVENLHTLVDYLPFSLNKVEMINTLSEDAGFSVWERFEYLFPIIRFHSRWSEFTSWDFDHSLNGYKSGIVLNPYRRNVENLSGKYVVSENREPLTDDQEKALGELLDYCDSENVKTLFVTVPQAIESEELRGELNSMEDLVRERGYPCLDILASVDELGIRPETDFYNLAHTNVHGSLKFTEYLSRYLVENYGLADKRGEAGWESWDEAAVLYTDYIAPYSLPEEREHAPRDYALAAPVLKKPKLNGFSASFSWEASEGAEGYKVYRKQRGPEDELTGPWTLLAAVDSSTLHIEDDGLSPETRYTYTVIPFRSEGGTVLYGEYDFTGVARVTGVK